MNIWFSADHHFGHTRIAELTNRPWTDVDEMNEALIDNHNAVVADDDLVILVGDLCMGKIAESLELVRRLRGNLVLVSGNHDRTHPCYNHKPGRREEFMQKYQEVGLTLWPEQILFPILGTGINALICHFPYTGDSHGEDRYAEHRPVDTGRFLLHGHVHDSFLARGRMYNVGVDVHDYFPVSLDTIISYIKEI